LKQWATAPWAALRLLGWKLALLTHRSEIPDNQDLAFVRMVAAPALGWAIVDFGIVFPLAAVGLARGHRTSFWWFLSLATGLGLAATAVFFVVGRYRVPWVPGLTLLAAAGVVDLADRARQGDWRGIAWRLGVLGLPAALLSWRPQADPVPSRWGNQLIAMAVADLRAGQLDPAIDALDLARASGPETAEVVRRHVELGPFHDLLRAAIDRELGQGARANSPAGTGVPTQQGRWLRQTRERSARARSLLEQGLRDHPEDARVNREWGAFLLSWPEQPGDRTRALHALERASRGPRGDYGAALLLTLATSDLTVLERSAALRREDRNPSTALVRAMVASRPRPRERRDRSEPRLTRQ
jgi:hypothetical protein